MSDFNLENGVDLSDLSAVAVAPAKEAIAGETVFERYLRISLERLEESIKEAKGRFDENDPTYAPYERPVKSFNWAPKNKEKAGPNDKIKVWATCGGSSRIPISKGKDGKEVEILEVFGRDVVTALERFKAFLSHPDFEKSSYGQTFRQRAEKNNAVKRGPKKKKDSSAT